MLNFQILIPKVKSNLSAINVKEELQGTHIIYAVALHNPFGRFDWQREENSQWQIFDVRNGLMSAFDRDIGGGGEEWLLGVAPEAFAVTADDSNFLHAD